MTTILTPEIGYALAAAIAKEASQSGATVRAVAIRMSGLSVQRIAELFGSENEFRLPS